MHLINFQPSTSPVPAGYQKDDGSRYDSGRGYGWNRRVATRDRQTNADFPSYDTFIHLGSGKKAVWQYDIPNGDYIVSLASGDPTYVQGPYSVQVEGDTVIDNQISSANEYLTITEYPVTVTDGQMTVTLIRGRGNHAILNYLTIKPNTADGDQ